MKNTQESISLPDFELTSVRQTQDDIISFNTTLPSLISEHGKGLIVYFYPKDNTQGCSIQAVDFSENLMQFHELGYDVVGVSRDGVKSHQNFISKKNLNFCIISDGDERLCQHFDVIKEKMMYGKTHLGVVRSTFVFDKDGQMTASFRNVKAKEHVNALLDFLTNG